MRQEKIGGARDDQLLAKPAAEGSLPPCSRDLPIWERLGKNGAPLLATKAMPSCEDANWPKGACDTILMRMSLRRRSLIGVVVEPSADTDGAV